MKFILEENMTKYILLEKNGDGIRPSNKPEWDEEYQNIKTPAAADAFWKTYFQEEWGANAAKMQALGEALLLQLRKLGFTTKTNPFLTFLNDHYLSGEKLPLTAENYAAISNAVNSGYLMDSDLLIKTPTAADFCAKLLLFKNLYTQAPKLITRYFQLAREFKKNITPAITAISDVVKAGVPFNNLFYVLFTNSLPWTNLTDATFVNNAKSKLDFSIGDTLRPAVQITSILQQLSGKQLDEKEDVTDTKVVEACKDLTTKSEVAQGVLYLILTKAESTSEITDYVKYFNTKLAGGAPSIDASKINLAPSGNWVKCIAKFAKLDITKAKLKTPILDTMANLYIKAK